MLCHDVFDRSDLVFIAVVVLCFCYRSYDFMFSGFMCIFFSLHFSFSLYYLSILYAFVIHY